MQQPMISACLIVRNEEEMLPGCLESIRNSVDEIIIVDTGSQDRTMEIARSFGAKVLEHPWADDFAEARNVALEAATGKWILSFDADERLTNPEELRWVVENAGDDFHGFLVNHNSHAAKAGVRSHYTSQVLRLFRNDKRIRFAGRIHEQIVECFAPNNLRFAPSNIDVQHLGYDVSDEQMNKKQLRNKHLLDVALRDDPNDAYMLQQRAKTLLALGDLQGAERDTQRALLFAMKNGVVRPQALNYGSVVSFQLKNYDLAIQRAEESLRLVPHQAFAFFVLGETHTACARYKHALQAYLNMEKAVELNDVTARVVGAYQLPAEQLSYSIGRSALASGDAELAERAFRKGIEQDSRSVNCRIGLANCAMNVGEFAAARELLLKAQQHQPEHADIPMFLKRIDEVEALHKAAESAAVTSTSNVDESAIPSPENTMTSISDMFNNESAKTTPERPLLSLCMIVKNEQAALRKCLESVQGVVDEIVIVDTGSSDKTMDIAREFNATTGYFEWIGDFAKARNEALKLCTGEWILYLDADERLDAETADQLRPMLQSVNAEVGAFICTIVSPHRQGDGVDAEVHRGGYPRLFRNYGYPKVEFRGRVHEQITPSLIECGAHILNCDINIIHTGYDVDRERMEAKVKRNYELLIKHVQEEPLNAYAWFQLGQTLSRMNVPENAEQALTFAIELGTLSTPIAASAASSLAHLCGTQHRYEEALKWSNYSLAKIPNQIMAMHYKAYALMYLYRFDESEKLFFEVLHLIENKDSLPEAGYEVDLKPSIVHQGLMKLRQARTNPRPAYAMQD